MKQNIVIPLVVILIFLPAKLHAESLPLFEMGVGIAPLYLPDYHGSDEVRSYVWPLPLPIFRSQKVQVDDNGIRAKMMERDRFRLDFSVGAGLPVNGKKNAAREGMSDIDGTIELGPELRMDLLTRMNDAILIKIPVRGVASTDFKSIQGRGFVFIPQLHYELILGASVYDSMGLSIFGGPIYSTEQYHDYYYEIESEFATESRPEFDARGGFSGTMIGLTYKLRLDDFWLGGFVRYEDLRGAVFEDSPLVKTNKYFALGLGLGWYFYYSEAKTNLSTP